MIKKFLFAVLALALGLCPVQLAAADNSQKLFEDSVYIFPNPVRGQGTFKAKTVRANGKLTLKVYTLNGTLVLTDTFPAVTAGNFTTIPWQAVNASGKRLERGLYYYTVREESPDGVLQATKKMVVIP